MVDDLFKAVMEFEQSEEDEQKSVIQNHVWGFRMELGRWNWELKTETCHRSQGQETPGRSIQAGP